MVEHRPSLPNPMFIAYNEQKQREYEESRRKYRAENLALEYDRSKRDAKD